LELPITSATRFSAEAGWQTNRSAATRKNLQQKVMAKRPVIPRLYARYLGITVAKMSVLHLAIDRADFR
jgi:hypothetical protein